VRVDDAAPGAVRVQRALLSVSDKRGIVDFARGLAELGVELVSTGVTAIPTFCRKAAVPPLATSSTPSCASPRANGSSPSLS